jgi:hypothetical protein
VRPTARELTLELATCFYAARTFDTFARAHLREINSQAPSAIQKQPAGQISKNLSSPSHKNIPLHPSGKSSLQARPVSPG